MKFKPILIAIALVFASIGFVAPAKAVETQTCDDQTATIVSSDRIIYGTDAADVILVEGQGRHKVLAGKGADIICGSDSKDRINGGAGADKIFGDGANDYLIGGTGRDMIMAGDGDDQVFGGPARDAINGGEGLDAIDSGIGINYCAADASDTFTGDCILDETAPTIYDVVVPTSVEAGSTAVFSWKTDDASGIDYTGLYIGGTYGWVGEWCDGFVSAGQLIAGDKNSGSYQVECVIPETAVNGTYSVFIVSNDILAQSTFDSSSLGFEVTGGISDNEVPNLVSITHPEVVTGTETFTINLELTDESGVESAYIYIAHEGFFVDLTTMLLWAEAIDWPQEPVSGDRFNGVWQQSMKMMDYAPSGTYTIWYGVADIYGNRNFVTGPSFTFVN